MKYFSYMFLVSLLLACGAQKDEPQEVTQKENKVGPFDLKVSSSDRSVVNEFSADIAQNEGRVDFNFTPDERVQLQFETASTSVTGCDASKVSVAHFWYENAEKTKEPIVVRQGQKFYAAPKVKNTFAVAFVNLGGCKKLIYKLNVKKIEWPKRPSTWDAGLDPRLLGNWEYRKGSSRIQFFVSSTPTIGWLEDNGVSYTCDRTWRTPKTSSTEMPNWLIDDGQGLDCTYKLSSNNESMRVTCQSNGWNCSVPDDFEFVKR